MTTSKYLRNWVETLPDNFVFGVSDVEVSFEKKQAVSRELQRMEARGELRKISKGKYYKPRQGLFGESRPSPSEISKDLLYQGEKITGYLTGQSIYSSIGLSTQISIKIEIGSNRYRQPLYRDGYEISFIRQANPINENTIPILQILDCIRNIKKIPATTPDQACVRIKEIIRNLNLTDKEILVKCTLNYPPFVRAITGAILELTDAGNKGIIELYNSLSGVSRYHLPITLYTLPNKLKWKIYEPARK